MEKQNQNKATQGQKSADQGGVEDVDGNARDREMGRDVEPLGDLGHGHKTWTPPAGKQGMSNRPDDGGSDGEKDSGDHKADK